MSSLRTLLGHRAFFVAVLVLFIIQALWVALTLAYPGIFDESWHYQIIQQYAAQWSPFITHQAPSTYNLGALEHDPSFLFYYVMSLIYRGAALLTANDSVRIIILRLGDIVLFGLSLVWFRKAFIQAGISRAIVQVGLLFFVLVPVVPFLAAQINNDNLVMVWAALTFLMVVRVDKARRTGTLRFNQLAWLVIYAVAGSVTQYVFLPVTAVVLLYALAVLGEALLRGRQGINWRERWRSINARSISLRSGRGMVTYGLLILATLAMVATYGVNVVEYHAPTPSCNVILTTDDCLSYYTFNRNYTYHATRPAVSPNPAKFTAGWLYKLYTTSFYTALNGSSAPLQVVPLPLPALTAGIIALVGAILCLYHARWLYRTYPTLVLAMLLSLFFIAVFWVYSYHEYLYYKAEIGINGRYLFPVDIPLMMGAGVAITHSLRLHRGVLLGLLVTCFILFLEGGGVSLYIIASDPSWWWSNAPVITLANAAKHLLQPVIINFRLFW